MGVVVTAVVRHNLIYQGVTLGGTGKKWQASPELRCNNVVVGAGAKVLGNLQIGHVRIGAGSVVLQRHSDCTVVGVPGRIVYQAGEKVDPRAWATRCGLR